MPASSGALARLAIAVVISGGCAPVVDGPIERQRAIDRDDGDRLAAQLAQLPGVVTAGVVLHRAVRDPLGPLAPLAPLGPRGTLGTPPPAAATLSAVITIDDRAAPGAIRAATERLARAALPELAAGALAIEIHASAPRPALARVGPFAVEASSQAPLKAVLVLGCVAIAALAGALARQARGHRRGNSAQ